MDKLVNFLLLSSGSFGGAFILIDFIIAPLTLGRKFDKVLDKRLVTPFEPGVPYLNMTTRCMAYMFSIVFFDKKNKRPKKSTAIGYECQQYDFRGNASKFEVIISFIFVYSFFLWIGLGIIYFVLNLIS